MNPARSPQPRLDAETQRVTRKVFDEVFGRVWLALARYDLPLHDRYDLAQDILLAALESWPRYDAARGEPAVWLNGIIRNHLLRYQERQRRQRRRFAPDDPADDAPGSARAEATDTARDALELLMFDEKRRLAHQLYRELPFDLLSVLIDHDLDELTLREVAERHGIPISTAHDRYNAAVRELRAALKRWEAKHRDRGVLVLPCTAADLLDADRAIPDVPVEVRAYMWERFSSASTPGDGGGAVGDQGEGPAPAPLRRAALPVLPEAGPPQPDMKVPASLGLTGALPAFGPLVVGLVGGLIGGASIYAAANQAPPHGAQEVASAAVVSSAGPVLVELAAPSTSASVAPPTLHSAAPPTSAGRAGPVPVDSETLLREEAAFDTARAAFVQGNMAAAISALALHARDFPRGQHAPERDKMWIDALLGSGRHEEACRRAEGFRKAYPRSGYLPAIERACPAKP